MFISMVKIYPSPGREQAVIEVLNSLRGPIATFADCLGSSVTVEAKAGGEVCYTERWRNREALDRHLASALYGRVLEAMESSRLPPEVAFYEASDIGGLELIERVRLPHGTVKH